MVERLPPLQFNRVGEFDRWVRVLLPGGTIDDSGGLVPGPPILVAQILAAIEPIQLSRFVRESLSGGAIADTENYHVTFWWVPGVTVSCYFEFDDVDYPPPADGSAPPVRTRILEIGEIRQVKMKYRYIECFCKERVS